MYAPTSSSSPSPPNQEPLPSGLTRYGSAPGSFLTRAVESVIGPGREYTAASQQQQASSSSLVGHYFTGETSSETTCKVNAVGSDLNKEARGGLSSGLQRSYGFNDVMNAGGCSLVRQKSSPAGFLSHLVSENGFSITRGGSYNGSTNGPTNGHAPSRLKPQLSFTRQDSLSQISEVSESLVEGLSSEHGRRVSSSSYQEGSFRMDPWESSGNIAFSGSPSKKLKTIDGDFYNYGLETQFSLPQTTLEMAAAEKFMHIPEDSVPCKIRAKRGCATHPRSIAERERRTRISGKLKKLQDLVPNMDKQSSYADMLDLAVQHIKGLQQEVNRLHKEMENCTCGSKTAK